MSFAHTPYDGANQPFTIGVEPLDPRDWIEPDEFLARDLAQKEDVFARARGAAVRLERGTRVAQAEVLGLLAAHLPRRFPQIYRADGTVMEIAPAARRVDLDAAEAPLVTAARLVQEDLCLMRRFETGWRLVAGVVCFPSSWSLGEKIGRDLGAIHAPVPGFAGRMENVATRIFDNIRVGAPLKRVNWSIYNDSQLRHPPGPESAAHFDAVEDALARAHIRVEPQTLTRLPATGDILFTIRVHADPMARLAAHPRGRELASSLRAQLLALSDAQMDYKGLTLSRDKLARALEEIAIGAQRLTSPPAPSGRLSNARPRPCR